MNLGLKGRVALVTAASKGIGYGTAKVLAEEGCKVVVSSRSGLDIEKARVEISESTKNDNVLAVPADLTSEAAIDDLVKRASEAYGDVEILAYNTGSPKPSPFLDLTNEDWDYGVRLLLMSAVWLARRVLPPMKKGGWGRLVFITSLTLKEPVKSLVLSNVVRLSIAGLSKDLSEEFGGSGITSNVIMQGHIFTERQRAVIQGVAKRKGISYEEAEKWRLEEIPANRFGTPEEIGNAVAFLASDKGAYINGAGILVDGGVVRSVL